MSDEQRQDAKHHRLLIVDDEQAIVRTLQEILRQEGYEVAVATSGEEAVSKAAECPPDLVLSDVVMPGIGGIEACIQIRALHPNCKIVLLSGHAVVHDLMRAARARGYSFEILHKPIPPAELIERLRAELSGN